MSIVKGTYSESDPGDDTSCSVPAYTTSQCTRSYVTTSGTPAGTYDVVLAIWSGTPGGSTQWGTMTLGARVTVTPPPTTPPPLITTPPPVVTTPPPATTLAGQASGLGISPSSLQAGYAALISATVTNTGNVTATYHTYSSSSSVCGYKDWSVTLSAGQSASVSIGCTTTSSTSAGSYSIDVYFELAQGTSTAWQNTQRVGSVTLMVTPPPVVTTPPSAAWSVPLPRGSFSCDAVSEDLAIMAVFLSNRPRTATGRENSGGVKKALADVHCLKLLTATKRLVVGALRATRAAAAFITR